MSKIKKYKNDLKELKKCISLKNYVRLIYKTLKISKIYSMYILVFLTVFYVKGTSNSISIII